MATCILEGGVKSSVYRESMPKNGNCYQFIRSQPVSSFQFLISGVEYLYEPPETTYVDCNLCISPTCVI